MTIVAIFLAHAFYAFVVLVNSLLVLLRVRALGYVRTAIFLAVLNLILAFLPFETTRLIASALLIVVWIVTWRGVPPLWRSLPRTTWRVDVHQTTARHDRHRSVPDSRSRRSSGALR